jgi:hypothetical protein
MSSIQEQIKSYLEANPTLMSLAEGGVWTRPLKRGERPPVGEEYTGDSDPTPEAFDPDTGWVLPCIVISPRIDTGAYYGLIRASGKYMVMSPIVAYYAPPTDQQGEILTKMSLLTGRTLLGKKVEILPGEGGNIVIPHMITGSIEIPEMPNSGVVMVERLEIDAVFDRT